MCRIISLMVVLFLTISSAWADDAKHITLATTDWPPYVGKDLPDRGYLYQVVQQILQSKGYETEIQFMPWAQAKQVGQQPGHGFFPAYEHDLTHSPTTCSMPFDGGPIGLFRNTLLPIEFSVSDPSHNQAEAFKKLDKYTFGVVKGYSNTKAFDQASYLKKVAVDNDFDNLKQLQEGKVDLVIMDVFVGMYLIEHNPGVFTDIEFLGPALENKKLYLCVGNPASAQYPAVLSDFNAGLIHMKASGEFDALMDKYGL